MSRTLESDKNAILLHAQTTRVLRGRKALHHLVCVGVGGVMGWLQYRAVNVQSEVMCAVQRDGLRHVSQGTSLVKVAEGS